MISRLTPRLIAFILVSGFCALTGPAVQAQNILYWTDSSTQWAINTSNPTAVTPQWSLTQGGPRDQRWTNGFSAVINASNTNPQITLAPNDVSISVDMLTISNSATFIGGSTNTRFLTISGGGSGNLIFEMTSALTAVNGSQLTLSGTSAWNGTITLSANAGDASKNRVRITTSTAVGVETNLNINGARLDLSTPTTANSLITVGQLKGTGGIISYSTATGFTKTLKVNQSSDTSFSGAIQKSGAGTTALIKEGVGSLTLSGINALDKVYVNTGTLLVNGSITGTVTVSNGGILGGSGSIGGSVIVDDNAVLGYRLGESDNLSYAGLVKGVDGTYVFDFEGTGILDTTYTLTSSLGAGFTLGNFNAINLAAGLTGDFSIVGTQLQFTASAIPEPSTIAILTSGLICLGLMIRRQSEKS